MKDATTAIPKGPKSLYARYYKRLIAPIGLWTIGDWNIKAYGIHQDTTRTPEGVLDDGFAENARDFVASRLPVAEEEGHHRNCGFAIIHQGAGANWLVFNWWTHEFICCEQLGRCKPGPVADFAHYTGPAMACVWEMVVIEHEKKAWIEHALNGDASISGYLNAWLAPGQY